MKKLFLPLCFLLPLGINAQKESSPMRFVETVDSITIYNIMVENAPGRLKMKDVPRFTLVGKDSKFYLGIGANLKFVADYDWGNPISNPNEFAPAKIPFDTPEGSGGKTQFSVGQSNFYLNFVALPGTSNQLGIYLDINFLGESAKTVALHHAYLKYRGITAGYVVSTFTDLAADPAAIDFAGPNAITFVRHPNISYTGKFGKDKLWSAAIGLDMPDAYSVTSSMSTKSVSQRMPDIPFYLQRSWAGGKGWFRASAIFRDLIYRDDISHKNVGQFGWGVKVSGKTPIVGGLSGVWQAVYGKGVSSYIQDLSGLGLDLVPCQDNNGKLQTIKSWGAYGTLRYDFSKKVFMDFTYSQVRAYAPRFSNSSTSWGDLYKYGQYVTANLFWNINSFTQFGVEYLWGRRVNLDGTQRHDNRIMAMLQIGI